MPVWIGKWIASLGLSAITGGRFAEWIPTLALAKKAALVVSYVIAMAFAAWFAVKTLRWWEGDKLTPKEAVAQCNSAVKETELKQREAALAERQKNFEDRVRLVGEAEKSIATMRKELDDERNASPGDAHPALAGDDPWLRAWARRGK